MNPARLARKWSESSGDYGRMAEALGDEIDDPAAGLLTRDYLDKRLAELEGRISKFESSFTWKIIGLFGVQIMVFSLITKYL
jgi:hypothetical protein